MYKAILLASSLAGLVVTGVTTAALAGDTGTPAMSTSEPSATVDPDKIVCRAGAPVTGTRLGPKRECATQREWDERRDQAQKDLMNSQSHGGGTTAGSPQG